MQVVFEQALNEVYMAKLTALISYLRRQQNLIAKMRTTCPKVANTRWLSIFQVAHWLCENALAIRDYLHTKKATCAPNSVWWIFLFALREVAREANAVFISLRGLSTLVKQQQDRFEGLVSKLCSNSGMLGPLGHRELKALDDTKHEKLGRFAISHAAAQAHVTSLDLWVCDSLAELPKAQKQSVIVAVARTYVLMASGIDDLVVSEATAYPVTPKELCATSMPQFSEIIKSLRPRLVDALGEAQINTIAAELRALHKYHADSKSFRDVISALDHRLATFDSMWLLGGAGKQFPHLAAFCGTLASSVSKHSHGGV